MKTLIVDDDVVGREILSQILTPYGPVDTAKDGISALCAVIDSHEQGDPYNLICLDILMPALDGQSTLRKIRLLERARGIQGLDGCRIIMTTAVSDKQNILKAFNAQCEAYLVKPIQKIRLLREIVGLGLLSHTEHLNQG